MFPLLTVLLEVFAAINLCVYMFSSLPFSANEFADTFQARVESWNEHLHARVAEFTQETPQATVFFFSAHATISDVLENPEDYDLVEDIVADEGGVIWADYLHITSAVHKILADQLLASVPEEG